VELVRLASRPAKLTTDRRNAIEYFLERHAVVGVGAGQDKGERDAVPAGDQVALRAEPASLSRSGSALSCRPPFGRDPLSMHARL
jgi:hypothetical protein